MTAETGNGRISVIYSAAINGVDGMLVTVESAYAQSDAPALNIIGLPDTAIKESAGRVRGAARSSSLQLKLGVLTVNLAPADVKKEGSSFDLPILLSLVNHPALEKIDFSDKCFIGELSLTGNLRPSRGALPMAIAARDAGLKEIYVPEDNASEASAALGINVYPIHDVRQLLNHLAGLCVLKPVSFSEEDFVRASYVSKLDFSDVKGQESVKTAMEIAAAGYHNLLMIGPPGTGKSMLANRISSILPPLTIKEAIETTKVHSVAGILPPNCALISERPVRSPHHSVSSAGLVGGGNVPRPGEISLAHNGVLFLDELPEFDKRAMETLRQPLENGKVTITRVNGKLSFPCSFMLIAAMNPCRCGYFGHPKKPCVCSMQSRHAYLSKISGPLLDRIDIHVEVKALDFTTLYDTSLSESSETIRKRVMKAYDYAKSRFASESMEFVPNGLMDTKLIRKFCITDTKSELLLKEIYDRLCLSARGYDKILKLARTIADFDESEVITSSHIATAIQLRSLDREYFGTL